MGTKSFIQEGIVMDFKQHVDLTCEIKLGVIQEVFSGLSVSMISEMQDFYVRQIYDTTNELRRIPRFLRQYSYILGASADEMLDYVMVNFQEPCLKALHECVMTDLVFEGVVGD